MSLKYRIGVENNFTTLSEYLVQKGYSVDKIASLKHTAKTPISYDAIVATGGNFNPPHPSVDIAIIDGAGMSDEQIEYQLKQSLE